MPVIIIRDDSDGVTASSADTWIVADGAILSAETNAFTFSSGATNAALIVRGSVVANNSAAILVNSSVAYATVTVETGGSVAAYTFGVKIEGTFAKLYNRGDISAFVAAGLEITGGNAYTFNSGTIVGNQYGVHVAAASARIDNHGVIASPGTAILVEAVGTYAKLFNDGEILGYVVWSGAGGRLDNAGAISGDVMLNGDGILLINDGRIGGDVVCADTASKVVTHGTIEGVVRLGGGADTLLASGASAVEVYGEAGADQLRGGSVGDTISGGEDNDVLRGMDGDDRLSGDAGNDELFGGLGDDELVGGSGRDILTGGRGDNVLTGGSLVDTFVFGSNSGDDVVTDFAAGSDKIQLSLATFAGFGDLGNTSDGDGMIQQGSGVLIFAADGSSILLQNVQLSALSAGDFAFV